MADLTPTDEPARPPLKTVLRRYKSGPLTYEYATKCSRCGVWLDRYSTSEEESRSIAEAEHHGC